MFIICYLVLFLVLLVTLPTAKIIINDFVTEIKTIYFGGWKNNDNIFNILVNFMCFSGGIKNV